MKDEVTEFQVKLRMINTKLRSVESNRECQGGSYEGPSQVPNGGGEATTCQVKLRISSALTCKKSAVFRHVNGQGHTKQTRRGKIMIADRRQDGRQPLVQPASERKQDFTKKKMMLTVGFRRVYILQAPKYYLNIALDLTESRTPKQAR